jgi:hypothetical protein
VAIDAEPAELARLIDFAERPRTQDWSLRAALVRYAQPEPQRVNDLLDLVRRIEWALGQQSAVIERDGPELWAAIQHDTAAGESDPYLVGVLQAAREVDMLGDLLATWAVDRAGPRPDAQVDAVVRDVGPRLDMLGVPREERPPPRSRG